MVHSSNTICYSIPFILFYLLYVHIPCFSLHVNLRSCPFCFVPLFIETNKKIGQGKEILTKNVEESMQRCILLPVFHIQLFFIYSVYICCIGLQFCFFFPSILHIFLHINLSSCQLYFLCCYIEINKIVFNLFTCSPT